MPNPALTLDALQLMDAIARAGSFAGAAHTLGKVPSAVTYAVRRLEDDLDVLLFDRRGYRAQLTPAGDELLREGRHLLAAADDLARRVRRLAQGWEQELRIALDTVVPFDRLLPLLTPFCAEAPTRLRISTEVLGGTWDALVTGRADMAIGASAEGPEPIRLGAGYRSEPLGQVAFVFAVAPSHPLARTPEPLSNGMLREHRQILVGDTSLRLAPRSVGVLGAAQTLTVPTMQAKLAAQIAGLGVGYLPRHLAQDALRTGQLVERRTDAQRDDAATNTLQIAWRSDTRGKAANWWLARLREPQVRAALLG
jgi:DNA-binding transcriptional LysR family regulator